MNQEEQNFLERHHKYQGLIGFVRYYFPYLIASIVASPIVLTFLNPNIWKLLRESSFDRYIIPVLVLVFLFSILPFFTVAIIIWTRKQRKYKLLTSEEERYKPIIQREWIGNDKQWDNVAMVLESIFIFSMFISFGLLLAHNAPAHYAYPFESVVLYTILFIIYRAWLTLFSSHSNKPLYMPLIFKILFIITSLSIVVSFILVFTL